MTEAMLTLAHRVGSAYGPAAEALAEELRSGGGLQCVLQGISSVNAAVHRPALMVLSNLVSNAFDSNAERTKERVSSVVLDRLVEFVYCGGDAVAMAYALACLQNLCLDFAFTDLLRRSHKEVIAVLEGLVEDSPSAHVRRYAAGCLFNMVEAVRRDTRAKEEAKQRGRSSSRSAVSGTSSRATDSSRTTDTSRATDRSSESSSQARTSSTSSAPRRARKRSLLRALLPAPPQELVLAAPVMAELAKREAAFQGEVAVELHASLVIQTYGRRWAARRRAAGRREVAPVPAVAGARALMPRFAARLRSARASATGRASPTSLVQGRSVQTRVPLVPWR